MPLSQQLLAAHAFFRQTARLAGDDTQPCTLFFSISDTRQRAHTVHSSASSFEQAWTCGARQIEEKLRSLAARSGEHLPLWLRVERAINITPITWVALTERLQRYKRNYFRRGIAFDSQLECALTEQELNANAILYGGAQCPHATFNSGNFAVYAKRRFTGNATSATVQRVLDQPESTVYLFDTTGVFCAEDAIAYPLNSTGAETGWRHVAALTPDTIRSTIETASDYLGRQVQTSGQFIYGYFPCFDRPINTYNTLRHASSTYSMIEAWALTEDETLKAAIDRALGYLTQVLIKPYTLPDGSAAAFLLDTGNEIKLGGNAVCLLALVKYSEVTGSAHYLPLLEALANGMAWMQDPASGAFVHVLNAHDLSVKEPFRIIYYDGEAAFGLLRLYALSRNERWLGVVEKAFDYFILKEHWREHDHWLSYCVNELTRYRPDEKYFRFGLSNVAGYLGFVQQRITTFPTLLELMMAAQQMLARIEQLPALHPLLKEIELGAFYTALHHRARYLLNGYFWPEMAMFMRNPARIVGAFFIRHHAFRVRIDDVEHYLSGLIAYHRYLEAGAPQVQSPVEPQATAQDLSWDATSLANATQGTWTEQPEANWRASGLVPSMLYFKPLRMLSRHPSKVKPNETRLARIWASAAPERRPSAFLCVDPTPYQNCGIPALHVADTQEAMLQMGRAIRQRFAGKVVGVTGSFGKTTVVAMLAHALRHWGPVGQTEANANLPHGIAWNMASLTAPNLFWVLEMAVGRMPINSELVRPHIAVVTGLAPAHLEYHGTLHNLARKKSAIFSAMAPGGHAVLCRDMPFYEVFAKAANTAQLQIISFGEHPQADLQLQGWRSEADEVGVHARHADHTFDFTLKARGKHMVINALAVLATLLAAGLEAREALHLLTEFTPVEGRGNVQSFNCGEGQFQLINDAYNANPGSMQAALQSVADLPVAPSQRVLVLGDMLELGPDSQRYHLQLAEHVRNASPRHVVLCGPYMQGLYHALRDELPVLWFEHAQALNEALLEQRAHWFAPGDWVLVKSSGGTGLSQVSTWLTAS